jgi:hypothetical protein
MQNSQTFLFGTQVKAEKNKSLRTMWFCGNSSRIRGLNMSTYEQSLPMTELTCVPYSPPPPRIHVISSGLCCPSGGRWEEVIPVLQWPELLPAPDQVLPGTAPSLILCLSPCGHTLRKHRFNNPADPTALEYKALDAVPSGPEKTKLQLEILSRWSSNKHIKFVKH